MNAEAIALRGAVKAADDDLSGWLKGLVTGEGSSPSQIIVSGVLSVIPGLGQAMDVRDIIVGVIVISKSPTSPSGWLDMSITLVGCVPALGDALKTSFRMIKSGHALPRVLDAVSPSLKGNLEHWFRTVDWGSIAGNLKRNFDDVMGAFIHGLDGWIVQTVIGKKEVALLIEQIKDLRQRAPKMLDEAVEELQVLWKKSMSDAVPKSTAAHATPHAPSAPHAPSEHAPHAPSAGEAPKAKAPESRKTEKVERDHTATERAPTDAARSDTRRATKKKQKWQTGVPAEHITDYWCARNKRNLKKANNFGKLWEEWHPAGRQGIDHVWMQTGNPIRPGVIGETKSSLFGAFRFLAALPKDIQEQLQALGKGEVENPTPSGQPNIFHSEGRDAVSSAKAPVNQDGGESELKKGLGDTENKGVQMSHKWIFRSIPKENLTPAGLALRKKIELFRRQQLLNPSVAPPYTRWIIMVTGRQKHLHDTAKQHEIQNPVITIPDSILKE
ncbi:hypothetical protein LBW62_23005 [Ralstonia solanacearum]|uniref:hypothetical protein n=1 Tax=Ralstonia solanacearum TaxID=305 RepID=UPI0005ABC7DE|nr:hypothetical protein [Ralstonia solanacearum]MDB0544123.1 hypothetical protein [Ralstonia solanacearum]MDB0553897.1 hypothetical protein [Ralstonia solanacearum]MDB0559046.1 hypothetical protein [Ralstonia solanacearum]